jgi:mRNA-degrading endonuclease RelE of RelBE toxin-antitoxin system
MEVQFLRSFEKDLNKADSTVRRKILSLVARMEAIRSVSELPQVKKLKGHEDAFRLRVGQFRLGFFVQGNVVQLARLLDRRDIYRYFP